MEYNFKTLEEHNNKPCQLRLKLCKLNKTKPSEMEDLKAVLKKLPWDKARDSDGYLNELFTLSVTGHDLLEAVLRLVNMIKDGQELPLALQKCNVSTIHNKKSWNNFENYCGVFWLSVLRSIIDMLIYEDTHKIIDRNLTDGNVGGRKNRRIR